MPTRGFGVELEYVARNPSAQDAMRINIWEHDPNNFKLAQVQKCFDSAIGSGKDSSEDNSCKIHSDCGLSKYCSEDAVCLDRQRCVPGEPIPNGTCPVAAARWRWEHDPTVSSMTALEVAALGAGKDEQEGIPFEITSPGPPHVLSGAAGMRSIIEVMTVLQNMGIQAGPSSGMHVHVNVFNEKVPPGNTLDFRGVASVWAAYARYQLVIDEMLSPGRPKNRWGNPLFLGNCPKKEVGHDDRCSKAPCGCLRLIWERMHTYVQNGVANMDNLDLCNKIHQMSSKSLSPCTERYPHQRSFQVNLIPMSKYGTIEFRAHSATTNVERVLRWVQFVVAFVEHFGSGVGQEKMNKYFQGSADEGYMKLQKSQAQATSKDLFQELGTTIDKDSKGFFMGRLWEKGDPACDPQAISYVQAKCTSEDARFVTATIAQELANGRLRLHVEIPSSAPLDTVTVLLPPDGAPLTLSFQLNKKGHRHNVRLPSGQLLPMLDRNTFSFDYDPPIPVTTLTTTITSNDPQQVWLQTLRLLPTYRVPSFHFTNRSKSSLAGRGSGL